MLIDKPDVAKQLLKNWPDGLIGLDHYGKISFCNTKTQEILGWGPTELIGVCAHDLLCSKAADYAHPQNECPMCQQADDNVEKDDHFEAWWVGANGVYMNLDVRVLEPDIDDLDISKILMFSECSSGTVSQYEARRLAMFAEFSPVPILEIEFPMSIEFANPAMTDLMVEYGFNEDGIPNVLPQALEALVSEVLTSKKMRVNEEVEYEKRAFVWTLNPLYKGTKSFVQVYGLDVTELRNLQYELEEAKNIAERASEAKSHFLANMSHEIRTPMNAIVGFTEILIRSKLNEKQEGYCNKIKISSNVLLEVINDILDFSKIEAGKLKLESTAFNVVENIEVLSDLFADRAKDSGVEMIFDVDQRLPAMVIGDSLRLKQIMINLVSNALKFTTKGHIEIVAKAVRIAGGQCRIRVEVRDTGKGIPQDKQAKLFAPFTQEDESTTRQFGGTGLGLSICRSLVELMDGSIGVRSKEGQGSNFFFEANFGIADSISVLDRQMQSFKLDQTCKKVLILETNPILRRSLRHQLVAYGLDTEEFESGMALIDEAEWATKRAEILAIFCDSEPENVLWVEAFARELELLDKSETINSMEYYPILMGIVHLSTPPPWSNSFRWPSAKLMSCERPIKPSIVGRSIMAKAQSGNQCKENASAVFDSRVTDLAGYHVLIVDDNAFNRELAVELLQETNATLNTADDGQSAVALATKKSYDFILMDIQMPVMDGFEATKIIKSKDPNQIIIALTANAIKGDRERFMAAGFDDYLSKPVDVTKLYDLMYFWAEKIGEKSKPLEAAIASKPDFGGEDKIKKNPLSNAHLQPIIPVPEEGMPLEYKGLQIAKALKMVGNKRSLYFKLMKLFSENYHATAAELLKALQAQDMLTAGRLVHTIKGSASNLGAENLRLIAIQLEGAINQETDQMQAHLADFCAQLDETLAVMDDFVEQYQHLA